MCKVVLLGESSEITEIVRTFFKTEGKSIEELMPGMRIYLKQLRLGEEVIARLFVWDIRSELLRRNPYFLRTFLAGATCAIIVIDPTNPESLFRASVYVASFIAVAHNFTSFIILVVNKSQDSKIPIEKIREFGKYIQQRYQIPVLVFETSIQHFEEDFEEFLSDALFSMILKKESLVRSQIINEQS